MLALAAERAIEGGRFRRYRILLGWRKRRGAGRLRLGRLDLGGQDIPVLVTERLGDQLQAVAMAGFNGFRLQGIAQGVRHRLRIAKIAHESTSSSANGEIGAHFADPLANGEGAERD